MKAVPSLLAVLLLLSSTSLAQTAPTQPTAPDQQAVPTEQAVAGAESSKAEASGQPSTTSPSPTASTPSPEAAAANAEAVPAAPVGPPFGPGAKIFLEPMNEFEQFLPHSILTHKVPVVVVKEREQADFVMSGTVRVKKPGFLTGMVLGTSGRVDVSLKDAHTGNMVFACTLHRADEGLAAAYQYQKWADQCASRLKHAVVKKK
jgi:hypothetical protein